MNLCKGILTKMANTFCSASNMAQTSSLSFMNDGFFTPQPLLVDLRVTFESLTSGWLKSDLFLYVLKKEEAKIIIINKQK